MRTLTEHLIREIEVARCVPVTQLRAHWDPLAQRLIEHIRELEAEINELRRPKTRGGVLT